MTNSRPITLGLLVGAAVGCLLFAPFWIGEWLHPSPKWPLVKPSPG